MFAYDTSIAPEKRSESYGLALLDATYGGIPGVRVFDSGIPGPTFGITACTHGGETAGIDAMSFLETEVRIGEILRKGRLVFVISNDAAYRKCLDTGDAIAARYMDENMNRCCSMEALSDPWSTERRRVNALLPILSEFDVHFDIHSTYGPSETMAIWSARAQAYLANMNAAVHLVGLPEHVSGKPIIDVSERGGAIGIGMETGCVSDGEWMANAVDNAIRLMRFVGMLDTDSPANEHVLPEKANESLRVYGAIPVRDRTFRVRKPFSHGEIVPSGELIASDASQEYRADRDTVILMPSPVETDLETFIGEEYCFLAEQIGKSERSGQMEPAVPPVR